MALSTYDEAKAAVMRMADRTDIGDNIPDYFRQVEADITSRVKVRHMICRQTAEISEEYETLAGNYSGLESICLLTSPVSYLQAVDTTWVRERKQLSAETGRPTHYAIVGPEIQFYPAPDDTYTVEMLVFEVVPSLETYDGTHWVLDRYPDAYLYGALVRYGLEYGDVPDLPKWQSMYDAAIARMVEADNAENFGHRLISKARRLG